MSWATYIIPPSSEYLRVMSFWRGKDLLAGGGLLTNTYFFYSLLLASLSMYLILSSALLYF